jgi:hypothetical protein
MNVRLLWAGCLLLAAAYGQTADPKSYRLSASFPPEIFEWLWMEREFQPNGYQRLLDQIAQQTTFNVLTGFLCTPAREITSAETHDQIKRAVGYAHSLGFRVAFDLDVRHARGTFHKRYPDQQQWMLRVRDLPDGGRVEVRPLRLHDHMTWPGHEYEPLRGRVLGIFNRALEPLQPQALQELKDRVVVELPAGRPGAVVVGFEHRVADVFAPNLESFERELFERYKDVGLDGLLKDEWGFPPVYGLGPKEGDFWYSKAFDEAWRNAGGSSLVRDAVLMYLGYGGGYEQRLAAVNRYERLILDRNAHIEQAFYRYVKENLGPQAFVGTHATWGIMPTGDAFKNGYDWWQATRDYGQTDEDFPISIRTALAKKMGGAVWYNMYYNRDVEAYYPRIWEGVRAGGRLNFMPLWPPIPLEADIRTPLFHSPAMRAESRIRLLNLISSAPIDSPVAVVFGHMAALNWLGPHFGDLGIDFAEELGAAGFRADVIPSTEIESGALHIDASGRVAYGKQAYKALVFLNPEFEPRRTFEFLRQAARSRTAVFLRGSSRFTSGGKLRDPAETLVPGAGLDATPGRVAQYIRGAYVRHKPVAGQVYLADGTCIVARGENDPAGDEINEQFYCAPLRKVRVRARGVAAVKLAVQGGVERIAASDLRLLETDQFRLELPVPVDLALWRDVRGEWQGAIQGRAEIPEPLLKLTPHWMRLGLPPQVR